MAQVFGGHRAQVQDPPIAQALFSDTRFAIIWLIIRLYTGYMWLEAGYAKLTSAAWTGDKASSSIAAFAAGALKKTAGDHPDVTGWYATFLQSLVIPYAAIWSYAITYGEILVGIGLIVGAFTGVAAFFGGLMNANYLLAGTVSSNPLLFVFATWLVLAWKVAGYYGLDYVLLPALGVPGHGGKLFAKPTEKVQSAEAAT